MCWSKRSSELTAQDRDYSLSYLMFLRWKCTKEVKERGCAGCTPQWEYMTKDENSTSTVSIEALKPCCTIDAMEERGIVIVNILGAFMRADMNDTVHLKWKEGWWNSFWKWTQILKGGKWNIQNVCEARKGSLSNPTRSNALLENTDFKDFEHGFLGRSIRWMCCTQGLRRKTMHHSLANGLSQGVCGWQSSCIWSAWRIGKSIKKNQW